ncbi:MAG: Chorismate dehydratase [Phycisphaerae bacterium]|nr:Chorismate dehydratase [Phycisphaerae bacterium]
MGPTQTARVDATAADRRVFEVGAVRFFNTRPLIYGLTGHPRVRLSLDVPSALGAGLADGSLDVTLVPAIDYPRAGGAWVIVPDGCIASDGETLTVRIFSRVPIERIETLALDADSHTSVALARLILRHRYDLSPRLEAVQMRDVLARPIDDRPDSLLLIGDKVIQAGPNRADSPWPYQLDLGAAWRTWTGLPFVFAVWAARRGSNLGDLPQLLADARQQGLAHCDQIAATDGPALGWPIDLAREYLTRHLQFELTPRYRAGLERFYELAAADGLIERPVPVELHPWRFCG